MADAAVIRKPGEGKALWVLGSLFEIKAAGSETGGSLTMMEMTIGPRALGAPPHTHTGGEAVYVLEGAFRFRVGDRTIEAGPGTFLYHPKGTWEWFENVTDKPGRLLVAYTPGGIDEFFSEVGEPARTRELPPPLTSPPDLARLAAIAKRYGMEIKPPPGP